MPDISIDEYRLRLEKLQLALAARGIDLAILNQNTDLFYYTGSVQPLYLLVPATGTPVMLSRKALARIRETVAHVELREFSNTREMVAAITDAGMAGATRLGLTLDATAYATVTRMQQLFPGAEVLDISWEVRTLRMVKSPAELAVIRQACAVLAEVPRVVQEHFHADMTEIALSAALGYYFRLHGGDSLIRCRREGVEMCSFGVVTSGVNSLAGTKFDGLNGGAGLCEAVPYGASDSPIARNTPIMIDVGLVMDGYHNDQSRVAVWGDPTREVREAYAAMRHIQEAVFDLLRPGMSWEEPYTLAVRMAAELGYADTFMGSGAERVKFIGHGLGLELDDPPFIAAGMKETLVENMVLAIEPKVALPGIGVVGIEDTVLVTADGMELLTTCPRDLIVIEG